MSMKEILSNTENFTKQKLANQFTEITGVTWVEKDIFIGKGFELNKSARIFCHFHVPAFVIDNKNNMPLTPFMILNLNRIFQLPWGIEYTKLFIWNKIFHFELSMFDGDITSFIKFKIS